MASKTAQSSLRGFLKPASPSKTGKRASSAIDLDEDDDVSDARPRKIVRASAAPTSSTSSTALPTSAAVKPSPEAGDAGQQANRPPAIGDFELPLNANNFHTLRAPSFEVADAFSPASNGGREIRKELLDLLYIKAFLVAPVRKQLYDWLLDELPWYRVCYTIRGINIRTPRYTSVFGIDASPKSLSSYQRRPRPIPPVLARLKEEVERRTDSRFNFVLCNYYADGQDSISFHQDSEQFLGPNPTIASLTLGAPRDFLLRPKVEKGTKATKADKYVLESGDMVVMRGPTQANWEHSIPKRASSKGRINITFRRALHPGGTDNYYRYNVYHLMKRFDLAEAFAQVGDGPIFRWQGGAMVEQT